MKLETFFDKFELFANASDAMAKMRELVLELAVRGRLSGRRRADATPEWKTLIDQIDCRHNFNDSEPPFDIPDAWRWVALDDLGSCRVRNDVADDIRTSFVPMAMVPVKYGDTVASEERPWRDVKKGFTHFADGDVVMAKITPCFENGKSAVIRGLANGIGAGTTELHVFRRSTQQVLPEYVLVYIKSRGFIARGESVMTGSAGQKRVPRDYFSSSPFPLPPLAEQRRIVAKVDELMALCDRLEAQQQEREERHVALARASLARFAEAPTPANLEFLFHNAYDIPPADLRKSILSLAVQGKLVPQDPNDEAAREQLNRMLAFNAEQRLVGRARKSASLDTSAKSVNLDLPSGWSLAPLCDLVTVWNGRAYAKDELLAEGTPVLRVGNLFTNNHWYYSDLELEPEKYCDQGDLIYAWSASFGPFIWDGPKVIYHYHIWKLVPHSEAEIDKRFLYWVLQERTQEIKEAGHGVSMTHMTKEKMERLLIMLPPRTEQRRIVAKVDELMMLVDKLEAQLAAARITATNLLVAAAGELTRNAQQTAASEPSPEIERAAIA